MGFTGYMYFQSNIDRWKKFVPGTGVLKTIPPTQIQMVNQKGISLSMKFPQRIYLLKSLPYPVKSFNKQSIWFRCRISRSTRTDKEHLCLGTSVLKQSICD